MVKKRNALLILEKTKMNNVHNGNISINRMVLSYLPSTLSFFQHFCLFHNVEAQTKERHFLWIKGIKSGIPHSAPV